MDFFKKSCMELCNKLVNEDDKINSASKLDSFIKQKCEEYTAKYATEEEKNNIVNDELSILVKAGIQYAVSKKWEIDRLGNYNCNKFNNAVNDIQEQLQCATNGNKVNIKDLKEKVDNQLKNMSKYISYLKHLEKALKTLAKSKVKFFSIFMGVGTARYYRDAAKKIEERLKVCLESLQKSKEDMGKAKEEIEKEKCGEAFKAFDKNLKKMLQQMKQKVAQIDSNKSSPDKILELKEQKFGEERKQLIEYYAELSKSVMPNCHHIYNPNNNTIADLGFYTVNFLNNLPRSSSQEINSQTLKTVLDNIGTTKSAMLSLGFYSKTDIDLSKYPL